MRFEDLSPEAQELVTEQKELMEKYHHMMAQLLISAVQQLDKTPLYMFLSSIAAVIEDAMAILPVSDEVRKLAKERAERMSTAAVIGGAKKYFDNLEKEE